jgi:hypothetical protein
VIRLINDDMATSERWWPPRSIVPAEKGKRAAAARRRAQVMKVLTYQRVRMTPVARPPVARRTAGAPTVLLIQPGITERVQRFPGHRYRLATGARAAHPDCFADLAAAAAIVGEPFALTQGARR